MTRIIFLLPLILFSACSSLKPSVAAKENSAALRAVLQSPLPAIKGSQRSLSEYRGKVVMLHFISSWCGQCALEASGVNNLQTSFAGSPFTAIGVFVDDDPFQAQLFAAKHNIQFPLLLDITGELKTFFSVKELPTTIFLDKTGMPITFKDPSTGKVTAKLEGPRVWDSSGPVEMIASLVEDH